MRNNRWLQTLIVLLVLIAAVYLLQLAWQLGQRFAGVLLLFFLAWIIAFTLNPIVDAFCRARVPRLLAVTCLYLVIAFLVVFFVVAAVPSIVDQVTLLASDIPAYSVVLTSGLNAVHADLVARGVSDNYLLGAAQAAVSRVDNLSAAAMRDTLALAAGIASGLLNGIIVLVLSFYLALDSRTILIKLMSLVPPRYRKEAALLADSVAQSFGGFIRTQLLLACIAGTATGVTMRAFGLGYGLTVSLICGLVMLVPMVGNLLALVPPLVIASLQAPDKWTVLWVFLILWAVQQIMLNVVAPRLLGRSVGLHPLLVFFAMLLGASTAGPWGALFGVPIVAVGFIMARHFYTDFVRSLPLYQSGELSTDDSVDVEPEGARANHAEAASPQDESRPGLHAHGAAASARQQAASVRIER